jgi:hypothetical protein
MKKSMKRFECCNSGSESLQKRIKLFSGIRLRKIKRSQGTVPIISGALAGTRIPKTRKHQIFHGSYCAETIPDCDHEGLARRESKNTIERNGKEQGATE